MGEDHTLASHSQEDLQLLKGGAVEVLAGEAPELHAPADALIRLNTSIVMTGWLVICYVKSKVEAKVKIKVKGSQET